jgi:hypothetical protein
VRSWVHNLTEHNFFAIFHYLMGEHGQVNGPAQHDYQADVPGPRLRHAGRSGTTRLSVGPPVWAPIPRSHSFLLFFRGQVNESVQHDYQAGVPCLGHGCGTRASRTRLDYPSSLTGPCRAGPGYPGRSTRCTNESYTTAGAHKDRDREREAIATTLVLRLRCSSTLGGGQEIRRGARKVVGVIFLSSELSFCRRAASHRGQAPRSF